MNSEQNQISSGMEDVEAWRDEMTPSVGSQDVSASNTDSLVNVGHPADLPSVSDTNNPVSGERSQDHPYGGDPGWMNPPSGRFKCAEAVEDDPSDYVIPDFASAMSEFCHSPCALVVYCTYTSPSGKWQGSRKEVFWSDNKYKHDCFKKLCALEEVVIGFFKYGWFCVNCDIIGVRESTKVRRYYYKFTEIIDGHERGLDDNFLVCVEANPGPTEESPVTTSGKQMKTCRQCGLQTTDILTHLKTVHPFQKGAGGEKQKGKGKEADKTASLLDAGVAQALADAKGARDAAAEMLRQAKEKETEIKSKQFELKNAIDEKRIEDEYEAMMRKDSPPDFPKVGIPEPSELHRVGDIFAPSTNPIPNARVISELRNNELPSGIFFSSYYARLFNYGAVLLMLQVFMVFMACCYGLGPKFEPVGGYYDTWSCDMGGNVVHAYEQHPFDSSLDFGSKESVYEAMRAGLCLNGVSRVQSEIPVYYSRFSLGWWAACVYFLGRVFMAMPLMRLLTTYITFCYYLGTGSYLSGIWLIIFECCRMVFMCLTVGRVNAVILQFLWYCSVKSCKFYGFYSGNEKARFIGRLPSSLDQWLRLPMEKIKHIRLVLIPTAVKTEGHDIRPEFDRGDKLARQRFTTYRIAVEVRTDAGYRYYKDWVSSLPKYWYKENGRTLKRVVLNDGLMATALNRKTLLGSRSSPELAIDSMLRLMAANPHYQEDWEYMRDSGGSSYRDMAMVFGAMVSRTAYHDNQYF